MMSLKHRRELVGRPSKRRYRDDYNGMKIYDKNSSNKKSKSVKKLPELKAMDESDDDDDDGILEIIDKKRAGAPAPAPVPAKVVKKRHTYTGEEKTLFIEKFLLKLSAITTLKPNLSEFKAKIEALDATKNDLKQFDRINGPMLERWLQNYRDNNGSVVNQNRGRKAVDEGFVDILMKNVWQTDIVKVSDASGGDEDKFVEKIISCCYNYESIRDGIEEAKAEWLYKRPHFDEDDEGFEEEMDKRQTVKDLKGCDFWIHNVLVKRSMHRRKITTSRVEAK